MVPFLWSKERNVMTEIEVKHLSKTFEQKGMHVDALRDINLTIEAGDIYGIIGMSGAGKSTLVRCLNYLAAFSLVLVQQRVKKGDSNAQQSCRHAEKHEFRVPYRAEVSR